MKAIRAIVIVVLFLSILGCQPMWWLGDQTINDWRFSHPETFSSIEGIIDWTSRNINYMSDSQQYGDYSYWATPDQTYGSKAGDCKDFTTLAMYFAHEIGIDTEFVSFEYVSQWDGKTYYHAILFCNGKYYEPQQPVGGGLSNAWSNLNDAKAFYSASSISIDNTYSYTETMRYAMDHQIVRGMRVYNYK